MGKLQIAGTITSLGKISKNCGYAKIAQIDGTYPIIAGTFTFNNIAFNYTSFANNCSTLGLDPTTILNSLGEVDFSSNYIVIRAKYGSRFNNDIISDLGNGIINITSSGPTFGLLNRWYRFYVMCKKGWRTVRFFGTDYTINYSPGKIITYSSCGYQNINKLNEISGRDAPIGKYLNAIAFDYNTFAYNCQLFGFNPITIYNSLGTIDFSKNYVIIRGSTSTTITQEVISNIGNNRFKACTCRGDCI